MYIAFKGSGPTLEDVDDWLVNLTVQLRDFNMKESTNFSPKVHTGFHDR